MSITAAIAIYFIIWWTTLFAVLPFRVRSQVETGQRVAGSDPGAPVTPSMAWRVMVTTILATIFFVSFYFIYTRSLIKLEDMPFIPHHLLK